MPALGLKRITRLPSITRLPRTLSTGGGLPALPAGYVFLVDSDGAYLVDADGAFLIEPA